MKPIQVTEKFRPFSAQPGVQVPFPLLNLVFVIYPTKLTILDWKKSQKVLMSFKFKFKTPSEKFFVFQDLIKNKIIIQVHLEDNYAQFTLNFDPKLQHFTLSLDRYKEDFLNFEVKRPGKTSVINRRITKKKPLVLFDNLTIEAPKNLEVLFFGCHKKQEIERVFARKQLKEYLPLLFLWGQYVPTKKSKESHEGNLVFLKHLKESVESKKHQEIEPFLNKLMSSSFGPMMVPYLEDFKHWGFHLPKLAATKASPWHILAELYSVVRSLFIESKDDNLFILPHLPPELPSGKFVKIQVGHLKIHLEWTKKLIRRMIIFSSKSTTMNVHFHKNIKSFRLKASKRGLGQRIQNHSELVFKRNKSYFFDCFEK